MKSKNEKKSPTSASENVNETTTSGSHSTKKANSMDDMKHDSDRGAKTGKTGSQSDSSKKQSGKGMSK